MHQALRTILTTLSAAGMILPGAVLVSRLDSALGRPPQVALRVVGETALRPAAAPGPAARERSAREVRQAARDALENSSNPLGPVLDRLPAVVASAGSLWDRPASNAPAGRQRAAAGQDALNEVPRHQRWQIYFQEGITVAEYARELDFFGIELGAVAGGGEIQYARDLSKPMPAMRTAPAADEKRLYMSWRRGELLEADRHLMAAAGLNVSDKVVVAFYPEAIEQKLAELENKFAGRQPAAILRTRFTIRPAPGGYEFYVIDQVPLK